MPRGQSTPEPLGRQKSRDWNEGKKLHTNEYMFVLLLCIQVADLGPAACGQHNAQEGAQEGAT